MHTALNMRPFLPNFVIVKGARDSDPETAWELCAEMRDGENVVFDKACVDFRRLKTLDARGVSWVIRAKGNMVYEVVGQHTGGKWMPSRDASPPLDMVENAGGASAGVVGRQVSGKRRYAWRKCTILPDERIRLTGAKTQEHYPGDLRLETAMVEVKGKMAEMRLITDNFEWSAHSVCQLY